MIRGAILRQLQFCYFAVVFVLSSILPALGQHTEGGQLADYGFDTRRNWVHMRMKMASRAHENGRLSVPLGAESVG